MAIFGVRFGIYRYEADEFYRMALADYNKNNMEQALLHIDEALKLIPNHPEYHATRGLFFLVEDAIEKARQEFETALQFEQFEMLANYGMGVILYRTDKHKDALDYFKAAWAVQPERAETLYYLALTHHRLRQNDKALAWMQQAAEKFEAADDKKRTRDAAKWVRELTRLLDV